MVLKNEELQRKKVTAKRDVVRVNLENGITEFVPDEVVTEATIRLYVNSRLFTVFTCSPDKTRELVVGHLLTQGAIKNPTEILQLCIGKEKVIVKLHQNGVKAKEKEKGKKPNKLHNFAIVPETVLKAAKTLDSKAAVFKRTGGTHAAAVFSSEGEVVAFSEDIGRHNAVDKVIGEAALKHINTEQTILASTGRLTSEIVNKAANAGIPVVVSLAASTDKGIDVAQKRGVTLIGFVRGRRFNVYTHPERLSP